MLLAVDIGNSNICIGLLAGEGHTEVRSAVRMVTRLRCTTDEYTAALKFLLDRMGFFACECEGVVLCSVVPQLSDVLSEACRRLTEKVPLRVSCTLEAGLTYTVKEPERLGQDRIADAAGAAALYPLPLLTIDLGTATTCNVVDAGGQFLGGIILPGIQTGLLALNRTTAQLPNIVPEANAPLIGRDTMEALCSGAVNGTAAMLDGLLDRVEAQLGTALHAVATGGYAPSVLPACRRHIVYDENLLFKGLAVLWENTQGEKG